MWIAGRAAYWATKENWQNILKLCRCAVHGEHCRKLSQKQGCRGTARTRGPAYLWHGTAPLFATAALCCSASLFAAACFFSAAAVLCCCLGIHSFHHIVSTEVGTVGATYNRRFISVFFWILFRKIFSPALCYIWEIGKPYALDNYNTEGIWFLEF